MARWRYNLAECGTALREAISDGNEDFESCKNVMNALKICLERLKEIMPEDDYSYYFSDIAEDVENMAGNELYDYTDEQEAVEAVDGELAEFYDACDVARVWVAL